MCQLTGARFAIACNGGTPALQMALAGLGVQPGDQVLTSAFSYWATPAAVIHQNAIPVFVDIDKTHTIDPKLIEEKITDDTTAILPVHVHGMPTDMDPIMAIAQKHGLKVVGDACQAHGARYKGRTIGGIEDAAGFSFNRSKNLTGGEGGVMITSNEECYEFARAMCSFGARRYEPDSLGYNFRPHEMSCALACS